MTVLACVVTLGAPLAVTSPAQAVATRTVAFWSMDESPGTTSLLDSSGNGRNGTIGADVRPGTLHEGATGHRFATVLPAEQKEYPAHVNRVPHHTELNPDSGDFSVEIRYRTDYPFGNIIQKGQGTAAGGYWKVEGPEGKPRCLFRGGNGASRTGYTNTRIDDGRWHTIRCNRTSSYVEMYVDGVRTSRLTGPTGNIANTAGVSIGGKGVCDGVRVTCDYFVGDIDYVRLQKGSGGAANVAPTADLDLSCTGLICNADGRGTTDSDGAVQRYVWDYGDGTVVDSASVPTSSHTYSQAGTYQVSLTVTDDRGATSSVSQSVSVAPAAESISFVGQGTANANVIRHRVTVPASVEPGDALLLFLSQNVEATTTGPTGVTGWRQLDTVTGGLARTTVWTKVAAPGDAGSAVEVPLSRQVKGNLVVAAYRGVDTVEPVAAFARATSPASSATRITPSVEVPTPRSWGVSYWMHGDSLSTALTPPGNVTVRSNSSQTGGGRVTGLLADSQGSVPLGPYGGLSAVGAAASTTTTTWTVILRGAS